MTLYRQLIIAVAALFILLYGINVAVSLYHSRVLVEQQMQVHAQDTATSVALAMTQAAQSNDVATLETMFNAVSDSGYFRRMTYKTLDGETTIDRSFPVSIEAVPNWFVELMPLPLPEGRAEVASGWMRLGELTVTSHPGQAYRELWQVARDQLIWFALVTALVCVLAAFALRVLLIPLSRMEKQANAICEKQFIVQDTLPRTRELRRVVEAMNRMATRLKTVFEGQLSLISELQQQALKDSVTGLSSRLDFDIRLQGFSRAGTEPTFGALMIFAIEEFERVNEKAGRSEGNVVLARIGEILSAQVASFPEAIIARRQGPEFTVFVPNILEDEARQLAENAFAAVSMVEWQGQDTEPLVVNMGFNYVPDIVDPKEILSGADMALKHAQRSGGSTWCNLAELVEPTEMPLLSASSSEWRALLERAIEYRDLALFYQPVFSARRRLVGHEVFSRLQSGDNFVAAGTFIPLAERFGLVQAFDQLTLEQLAEKVGEFPARQHVSVNISTVSIQDAAFLGWLNDFLGRQKELAKRLVIELSEHAMRIEEHHVRELSAMLAAHGVRLGIDHFGLESFAFGYLGSLPLHHIKLHRSFVHELDSDPDNRFYIQSLIQVAHSRDIQFAVEGVEREEDWQTLVSLKIDMAQGYLLGQPTPERLNH